MTRTENLLAELIALSRTGSFYIFSLKELFFDRFNAFYEMSAKGVVFEIERTQRHRGAAKMDWWPSRSSRFLGFIRSLIFFSEALAMRCAVPRCPPAV